MSITRVHFIQSRLFYFSIYITGRIDFEQRNNITRSFSMITHVNDSNVLHILSIKAAHIERKYHNLNLGGNHNAKKT